MFQYGYFRTLPDMSTVRRLLAEGVEAAPGELASDRSQNTIATVSNSGINRIQ